MLLGQGVDNPLRLFPLAQRHRHPDILQHVRDLPKHGVDILQAGSQHLVDAVFDRVFVTQVVDFDRIVDLADALDAPFALLQAGGIPGQVQVISVARRCRFSPSEAASVPNIRRN
jgi:hypothetical protein